MTFEAIFVPAALREATCDTAWLEAMLAAECALAVAEARVGVIPEAAAAGIADACRSDLYDVERLASDGRAPGNPVEPLVRALRERVGALAAGYVHWGATSQDILDTAAMLVARRALDLVVEDIDALASVAAGLAEAHAETPLVGRTLLQQASPTTFGFKAAVWLGGVLDARDDLVRVRDGRLAVQLGSAVGTLAAFGERGLEVVAAFAEELRLSKPLLPWHSDRTRIAQLASALELAAASGAKIALDVALLAQAEVAEVRPAEGGVSSTLPHKRNPIAATRCLACARRTAAAASLLRSGRHEHERAVADWHAEWSALSDALTAAGGAVWAARELLEGLEVDAERMRENLRDERGLVLAERLTFLLADELGRTTAQAVVGDAVKRSADDGLSLRDVLARDVRVTLTESELEEAFDPTGYLGAVPTLVRGVLDRYRSLLEPAAR